MEAMKDERGFIEWFGGLALSVWVGGLATVTLAATTVFRTYAQDRKLAGGIVGAILADFRRMEIICAAAVLLGAMFLLSKPATGRDIARVVIAGLMAGLLAGYAVWIGPRLLELRLEIPSFDVPVGKDSSAARVEFQTLHALYASLSGANLLLGVILWTIWRRPTPAAAPASVAK